jgi:hypothetical protein
VVWRTGEEGSLIMTAFAPNGKAERVYEAIAGRSLMLANRFQRLFPTTMFGSAGGDELVVLNRYWRLQLSKLPFDTRAERECLCDGGDFEPWLVNFKNIVLPTIVANKLPVDEE